MTEKRTEEQQAVIDTAKQVLTGVPDSELEETWAQEVRAKIDERERMLSTIKPHLENWRLRQVKHIDDLQAGNPIYSQSFDDVTDWQGAMGTIGAIFQMRQSNTRFMQIQGKALLAYIWRVTFEFSTSVGMEERKSLVKAFGLDKNVTNTPNKALLEKLNAQQHRPLIVAQSIMDGAIPFKRDEILASFVRQVVAVDKYTYTDSAGEPHAITSAYMRTWIGDNWNMIKGAGTKSALMALFTEMGFSLSLEQKVAKSNAARDRRIASAVERAITSPDGRAFIDTISSLSADNKALACGEYDKQQLARGLAPIRPGAPLYFAMRVVFEKDKAPTAQTLERAISELGVEKAKLEARLLSLSQSSAASALVPAVKQAVDAGIVRGEMGENGKAVTAVVPVEKAPVVA